MSTDIKIQTFEYIVKCLCDWFNEVVHDESKTPFQDFNKLKLFKLHFFVTSIKASPRSSEMDLLNIFDNFYAMPYGPVESDVYDHLYDTKIYSIGNDCIEEKSSPDNYFEDLSPDIKNEIDQSIAALKLKNKDLVCYDTFRLVDISHEWLVWKMIYSKAINSGKRSEKIPVELIRNSLKIFK